MEIIDLEMEDMRSTRVEDGMPSSFSRGDKHDLLMDIRDEPDLYPEELDSIIDNQKIKIQGFNIIQHKLIAMQIEAPNVEEEIDGMGITDFEIKKDNQARVWLRGLYCNASGAEK